MKSKVKRNIIFSVFVILIFEIITSTFFSVKATSLNGSNYSKKNSNYNYAYNYNDDYIGDDDDIFNDNYNNLYDYYIESYNVDINVSNNNSYDIKETIVAYFNKEKHGIIRNIPTRNTVTRTDGSTNTNRAKITKVNVNEKYSLSTGADEVKLKIGDAGTVLTGRHTYQISYTYNIGNDKLKDADEFYLNLIGNQWDTNINKLTFTITMPKDFDTNKIGFSAGKYGTSGIPKDGYFNYSVKNNVITGTYNKTLPPNNGFTVRITLPDGYFEKQKLKITIFDFIAICLPIIFLIIAIFEWKKYGKDEKPVETVEFNPPDNMNSLDVAYAYKGKVNSKDVVSLLIYLANKGYIKIKVEETGSKLLKSKSYKIIKVKEYDGNDENERLFLKRLFKNGTIYRTKNNTNNNIQYNNNNIQNNNIQYNKNNVPNNYIQYNNNNVQNNNIQYNNNNVPNNYIQYNNNNVQNNNIQNNNNNVPNNNIQNNNNVFRCVTKSDLEESFYLTVDEIIDNENTSELKNKIFEKGVWNRAKKIIILSLLIILTMSIGPLLNGVEIKTTMIANLILIAITMLFYVFALSSKFNNTKVKNIVQNIVIEIVALCFCFSLIAFAPLYNIIMNMNKLGLIELGIQMISLIFIMILVTLMKRRTKYGTEVLGKILGFKTFLKTAEKEKLEMLVNQDPGYFYNILPYAYVLGVSDEWIKNFETISLMPPEWYVGNNSYYDFLNDYNNLMRTSANVMTSSPSSDFSGGSFSGGGGFSGGGSGGGGGSSW